MGPRPIGLQSDGKIVDLAGTILRDRSSRVTGAGGPVLTRWLASGEADPSFGDHGVLKLAIPGVHPEDELGYCPSWSPECFSTTPDQMLVLPDDKILVRFDATRTTPDQSETTHYTVRLKRDGRPGRSTSARAESSRSRRARDTPLATQASSCWATIFLSSATDRGGSARTARLIPASRRGRAR